MIDVGRALIHPAGALGPLRALRGLGELRALGDSGSSENVGLREGRGGGSDGFNIY